MRKNVAAMFDALKSQIREIPPQDYVASRSFLQSLLYATTGSLIREGRSVVYRFSWLETHEADWCGEFEGVPCGNG